MAEKPKPETMTTHDDPPAMILVGGRGTRLGHICDTCPKPMIPVAGVPFVEHIVRFLKKQGTRQFYLLTGYRGEQVAAYFRNRPDTPGLDIVCIQEKEPLGTGGAVLNAIDQAHITHPFLLLNGDSFTVFRTSDLAAAASGHAGSLVATRVGDVSRFGSLDIGEDGCLRAFIEKQSQRAAGHINSGIYYLKPDLFDRFPRVQSSSIERNFFPEWIASGLLFPVLTTPGPFLDIGTPESLAEAESFVIRLQADGML
jgi:NDP-sugar pyrophosphorylase family protein